MRFSSGLVISKLIDCVANLGQPDKTLLSLHIIIVFYSCFAHLVLDVANYTVPSSETTSIVQTCLTHDSRRKRDQNHSSEYPSSRVMPKPLNSAANVGKPNKTLFSSYNCDIFSEYKRARR